MYPKNYNPILSIRETEVAIKIIKDKFESTLASKLNLTRVSAPLFVRPETGLNDNLNGVERPVSFDIKGIKGVTCEIVHSLAKWKRFALKKYDFAPHEGLYTDMNAIRRDEDMDNLHSLYVDQWDWEVVINKADRKIDTLKSFVKNIYQSFKETEAFIISKYPSLKKQLSEDITFVTTQELEDLYPNLTPKERENSYAREKGSICVMQIGGLLKSGIKHDGRAPDYDDWQLNADIVFYYPILDCAFEVSSMGIRVDEDSLELQLKLAGAEDRKTLNFHKQILNKQLPYTIGGGIGQSRLCMFLLGKAHIGEVQCSIWPSDMISKCEESNIQLL